jgi:AcrR family transcriptional regulator
MMTYSDAMSSPGDHAARRSGRRPGTSGTRDAILDAARRQFAQHGFARATLRAIAADAGVDQKLIAHFFGSKQGLFVAAVGLPVNPVEILPRVLEGGDPTVITQRLADALTELLERSELVQPIAALIRAAATEPNVAALLREFFPGALLEEVRGLLGSGDPALRLNLFGTQIAGLVTVRSVFGVEPLASAPARDVADAVAPTLARYLVGPLIMPRRAPW